MRHEGELADDDFLGGATKKKKQVRKHQIKGLKISKFEAVMRAKASDPQNKKRRVACSRSRSTDAHSLASDLISSVTSRLVLRWEGLMGFQHNI